MNRHNGKRRSRHNRLSPKQQADGYASSNSYPRELRQEQNPLTVINDLRAGRTDGESAIRKLEHRGRAGIVTAGELCVELAMRTTDIIQTAELLDRAKKDFQTVTRPDVHPATMDGNQARALIHLAQLPNHAFMAAHGELPTPEAAQKTYLSTIKAATKVADAFEIATKKGDSRTISLAGVSAETSLTLLGQRYGIWSGIGSETWFMMLAYYSEDHLNLNTTKASRNKAWDATIFTKIDEIVEPTYRIQIKSSERARGLSRDASPDSGIVTVCVRPDLQLAKSESFRSTTIIRECAGELAGTWPNAGPNLEARTDKFLDKLDSY